MAKSKNPFPQEFFATLVDYGWNGSVKMQPVRVAATNGWYHLYPQGKWYTIGGSYRYYDIQRLFDNGRLMIPPRQEEEREIENLEMII